ncbi:T9SS type A sorting domain-containing protein [candidate division KSB1 bacterium]|nr:T9SS type A sorting domain-containing protein [candidate division KSB1 bacterium]
MSKLRLQSLLGMFSLLLFLPGLIFAQGSELVISPGAGVYLNEVIDADASRPTDRVYVLKRDGVYFMTNFLTNNGYVLRIRAEDGAGQRPVIYLINNPTTGAATTHHFEMGEDVILDGLILVGFLEADPNAISADPPRLIRTRAPGFDLIINNCILTQSRGEHIRLEQAMNVVKITNCVFANMGDLGLSNLGAGKPIDFRNAAVDSAIFINNTFVNFHDRIVRHRSSVGAIDYFIFDHNTAINSLGYHGTLALGRVGKEAILTNNLFIDTFIAGADTDVVRQSEFEEPGEIDPRNGLGRMAWVLTDVTETATWKVSGNYYSVSPEVQAFYDAHAAEGVLGEGPPLTYRINAKLGDDSTNAFIKEAISVANRPTPMIAMAEWYRSPSGGNKTKATGNFVRALHDYDRRPWKYYADTLDCSYPTSAPAYTGADGGRFPVGDLNWFPDKKAEWEDFISSVSQKNPGVIVADFYLEQNYPNPFNPSTSIAFALAKAGNVKLEIYNALGQKVATLINGRMSAGQHKATWDARNVPSGIYFYKLEAGAFSQTKKMVLMK